MPFSLFKREPAGQNTGVVEPANQAQLAETALNAINEGVMIISSEGMIKFINPAAVKMTDYTSPADLIDLHFIGVLRLENGEGMPIEEAKHPVALAVQQNQPWSSRNYVLVTLRGRRIPLSIALTPSGDPLGDKIITFRDITKELEEEGEQTEFISTASHEMRTPVASIEGYIGLALNPATATIDERARGYLTAAHDASQHLGRLFRDLLDVTKLDDKRIKVQLVPVEITSVVKIITDAHLPAMQQKQLAYSFGVEDDGTARHLDQIVYASVDVDFLREILDNLIENAIKYTPEGGSIWVNVRGDGDRVLINVTDSGIGISADDLAHIFQKFYRVDNSQTRTIGGTGLGLYLVKQRAEAMGGRVWAESSFGEGSTFYVSLPRLSPAEYQRRRQIIANLQATQAVGQAAATQAVPVPQGVAAPNPQVPPQSF